MSYVGKIHAEYGPDIGFGYMVLTCSGDMKKQLMDDIENIALRTVDGVAVIGRTHNAVQLYSHDRTPALALNDILASFRSDPHIEVEVSNTVDQ